jgi:hypothetical protein
MDYLVQFLVERKEELKKIENSALFDYAFTLVKQVLRNCKESFTHNEGQILRLKATFCLNDRGQISLLYELTRSKVAVQRQYSYLLECWLLALKHCFSPRLEITLGLLTLLHSWERVEEKDKATISLSSLLLEDQEALCMLLKLSRPGEPMSL